MIPLTILKRIRVAFSWEIEEVTKSLQKPADNVNIPSPKWLQSQMLVYHPSKQRLSSILPFQGKWGITIIITGWGL